MSKIKVGIVTKTIDIGCSGPSIYLENLCSELLKLKDSEVEFYFIHHKKNNHAIYKKGNEILCPKFPLAFMLCIASKDLDIIHYNCPTFKRFLFYFLPFKKIITLHGSEIFEMPNEYVVNQGRWLEKKGNQLLSCSGFLNRVDAFISVSEGLKRDLVKDYRLKEEAIKVIPNGVDLERFDVKDEEGDKLRKKHKIEAKETVGFFCSHDFERKGLKYIVKALPNVKKSIKVIIAGDDDFEPYRKMALELGVERQLIYVGNITKNIERYYATSDFFIFPTQHEAFSLVSLEAVASGLPLLTTKVNGTEELIKDGENGYFVERNEKSIAEKINKLLNSSELRSKLGENARKTAKKYSWRKMARRTLEVYKTLARDDFNS